MADSIPPPPDDGLDSLLRSEWKGPPDASAELRAEVLGAVKPRKRAFWMGAVGAAVAVAAALVVVARVHRHHVRETMWGEADEAYVMQTMLGVEDSDEGDASPFEEADLNSPP